LVEGFKNGELVSFHGVPDLKITKTLSGTTDMAKGKQETKSGDKGAGGKGGKGKGGDDKDSKGTKGAQSINVRHILVSARDPTPFR
jgi:hypothetical protein